MTVTENADKDGVEIRHAGKPSEEQRADMKAHGFRCTRRPPWVWYACRNARTLAYAYGLTGEEAERLILQATPKLLRESTKFDYLGWIRGDHDGREAYWSRTELR